MTTTTVMGTDGSVTYTGTFLDWANVLALSGHWHYTDTGGDTITVPFTGTQIDVYGNESFNLGNASYAVDGGSPVTVSQYVAGGDAVWQQLLWSSGSLTNGAHTLVVTCLGTHESGSTDNNIGVDYFLVTDSGGSGVTVIGVTAESDGAALAGVTKVVVPGPVAESDGAALAGVVNYGCVVVGTVATSTSAALGGNVSGNVVVGVPATSVSRALPGSFISTGSTVVGPVASSVSLALPGGVYTGPYIENFCPNPSVEVDLTGYAGLTGTAITRVGTNAAYGHHSVQVVTNGLASGQGVSTPLVTYLDEIILGSAGVDLSGETGTLVVSAYTNPGGVLLASKTVLLTPAWQRVTLDGLDLFGGDEFYLVIRTPFAQNLTFLVDAVQYEENSPASMYIDGDQPGCEWV
jgi:hypothetical protein